MVEIIGSASRSEPIPDEEIGALQAFLTTVPPYDPHPYLHDGMMVEVVRGQPQRVYRILHRKEKRHRLVIVVRLIQQTAAVRIDVNGIVPG